MSETSRFDESPGSSVRLRYASLVMYVLNIAGAVLSLYFITLMTRRLSVEEYGIWVMISRYVGYFVIPSVIYTQWLSRNISRGQNVSRTGLYTSIFMGLISMPFYFIIVQMVATGFEQPLLPLLLSAGLVLLDYIANSLSSIANGYSPQIVGYTSFVFKIGQAISGGLFVGMLALGLTGGVLAALTGRLLMNCASILMNRGILKQSKFERRVLVSWLRSSWLPLFSSAVGMIYLFDVVIVRILHGSEVPIAFFGVSMSILSVVLFSNVVVSALYPKVLSKGSLEDLREAIWLIALLTIPAICMILFYAQPICAIFGLEYLLAANPLRVFAVSSLMQVLSSVVWVSYTGLEKIDQEVLRSRSLLKSAMFKSTIVSLIINVIYATLITTFSLTVSNAELLVILWGTTSAISYGISFVVYIVLLKKDFGQRFPITALARDLVVFILPMVPASLPLFIFNIMISENFYLMFQNLLSPVLLSITLYFASLYTIDKKFRATIKDVLSRIFFHTKMVKR